MGTELKHLDFNEKTFVANGKTYRIDNSLCFERWTEYEKLEVHVGYGVTFEGIFETLKKIFECLNKIQFVEACALLHNLMNGIKNRLENRIHPGVLLCALFINYEGEDVTKYDKNIAEQKAKDWAMEYAINDFFLLAVNLVTGFIPTYKNLLENSLKKEETKEQNTTTDGA